MQQSQFKFLNIFFFFSQQFLNLKYFFTQTKVRSFAALQFFKFNFFRFIIIIIILFAQHTPQASSSLKCLPHTACFVTFAVNFPVSTSTTHDGRNKTEFAFICRATYLPHGVSKALSFAATTSCGKLCLAELLVFCKCRACVEFLTNFLNEKLSACRLLYCSPNWFRSCCVNE